MKKKNKKNTIALKLQNLEIKKEFEDMIRYYEKMYNIYFGEHKTFIRKNGGGRYYNFFLKLFLFLKKEKINYKDYIKSQFSYDKNENLKYPTFLLTRKSIKNFLKFKNEILNKQNQQLVNSKSDIKKIIEFDLEKINNNVGFLNNMICINNNISLSLGTILFISKKISIYTALYDIYFYNDILTIYDMYKENFFKIISKKIYLEIVNFFRKDIIMI